MNQQNKKSYVKPELSFLGSVEELTLQPNWGHNHSYGHSSSYSYSSSSSYAEASSSYHPEIS